MVTLRGFIIRLVVLFFISSYGYIVFDYISTLFSHHSLLSSSSSFSCSPLCTGTPDGAVGIGSAANRLPAVVVVLVSAPGPQLCRLGSHRSKANANCCRTQFGKGDRINRSAHRMRLEIISLSPGSMCTFFRMWLNLMIVFRKLTSCNSSINFLRSHIYGSSERLWFWIWITAATLNLRRLPRRVR